MEAIDLFAGGGGFTEGARIAGVKTVWASNHWRVAVDTHALNHPEAEHSCQDLQQANWSCVPRHDVMLAAPACTGHSPARGKEKPHHDALRATAWAVVSCAEHHRPPFVVVENVPAYKNWLLYPSWCDAMRRLGYAVSPHLVDAADHGVPQNRKRLFLVCTRSKHPLKLDLPMLEHRGIGEVIEWDAGNWTDIERPGRSLKTLQRCAAGRARFGERFVAPFYTSGSGLTGRCITRPIGTLTTHDRWAVINGSRMRMLQINEAKRAMGYRDSYILPAAHTQAMFMLGNAVCPPTAAAILTAIQKR